MVYYVTEDEADRTAFTRLARPAQVKHKYLQFVTVDPQDYPNLPGLVGIGPGRRGLSMWNNQDFKIYVHSGELEAGAIDAFISAAMSGTAPSWDGTLEEAAESVDEEQAEQVPVDASAADEEAPAGDESSDGDDEDSHDEL